MRTALEISLWLLVGIAGGAGVWRSFTWRDKPFRWCPTPRAIAAWVACAPLGPAMLILTIGGIIGSTLEWLMEKPERKSWWTRPICKDRDIL